MLLDCILLTSGECCRIQQPPGLELPNLEGLGLQGPIDDESQQYIDPEKKMLDDGATWEFIRWARQFWSKPIMVKVSSPLSGWPAGMHVRPGLDQPAALHILGACILQY